MHVHALIRRIAFFCCIVSLGSLVLSAEPEPHNGTSAAIPGMTHKVLANGLEVFLVENHAVPLATIMISFRCGGISQTPENAGLFHLYEHLMFDGNAKYPNQAAFMAALNRMGVSNWNGGTSNEFVNYHITIPTARLAEGLDFWAAAIREPLFEQKRLDREKKVVINEIRGYHADPSDWFRMAIDRRAFAYPWREDTSGPESNVANATLEQIRSIRDTWYIPNNAALFVGGDINPAQALVAIRHAFGDWKRGPTPPAIEPAQPPFAASSKLIFADPGFYKGMGLAMLQFRGPDALRQTKDTYVSDVLLSLMSSPVGRFKQDIFNAVDNLYDTDHIDFQYPTQRDGGQYYFVAYFLVDPAKPKNTIQRLENIRAAFLKEMALIASNPKAYFGADELALAKTKLVDENTASMETAHSFLNNLQFWWTTATTDYFLSYQKKCAAVSFSDISRLIKTWILDKPVISSARIREDAFNADPDMAAQMKQFGWETVDPKAAYWWQVAGK